MLVALTGTPGTGKTSVGCLLSEKGYSVIALKDMGTHCIIGHDAIRDCVLYDLSLLEKQICETIGVVFMEAHFSHLLSSVEKVVILRCHPDELQNRLKQKGWSSNKILENIESEALDIIRCDIHERYPLENINEIDTTTKTVSEVAGSIDKWVQDGFPGVSKTVDWSNWIVEHAGSI